MKFDLTVCKLVHKKLESLTPVKVMQVLFYLLGVSLSYFLNKKLFKVNTNKYNQQFILPKTNL